MSVNLIMGVMAFSVVVIAAIIWVILNFKSFVIGVIFTTFLMWLFSGFGLFVAIECLTWESIIGSVIGWFIIIVDVIILLASMFGSKA